jgi:N6-L-threonylcarbamoyladenine synthase
MVDKAMEQAGLTYAELDAIAATAGPGLIGGVMVGLMLAKGIAVAANKPLLAVNHLEGHALTVRLVSEVQFPYLLLLLSGGHCQVLVVHGVGSYTKLGCTLDDAVGEVFDKVARMLALPSPGGPELEKRAHTGDERRFNFPRALKGREGCDFSFSGLKTAVKRTIDLLKLEGDLTPQDVTDIAASFQICVGDILVDRLIHAIAMCKVPLTDVVIAGGVAANQYLGQRLRKVVEQQGLSLTVPPMGLCTDNAAMIGWAGIEKLQLGLVDGLDFNPRARWSLV